MEETTPRVPQKLRADLKTLHRQLEELDARVLAERTPAAGIEEERQARRLLRRQIIERC